MCGGGPSIPDAPPPPPVTPAVAKTRSQPKLTSEGVRKAQSDTKDAARRFAGTRGGSLVTGPGGLSTEANTQKKSLLGG
jgi:hypothetical protein